MGIAAKVKPGSSCHWIMGKIRIVEKKKKIQNTSNKS
jgi:hypothetical protein